MYIYNIYMMVFIMILEISVCVYNIAIYDGFHHDSRNKTVRATQPISAFKQ